MSEITCSIEGCQNPIAVKLRGWCKKHYSRWHVHGDPMIVHSKGGKRGATARAPRPIAGRLWAKVDKASSRRGCWLWTGGATKLGYGSIWDNDIKGHRMVHRLSWELLRGPIPDGFHIDHLCRTPRCVNPDHLEPVLPAVNTARGLAPIIAGNYNRVKRFCPNGHPYEPPNLYVSRTTGGRSCLICINTRTAARREAKRKGIQYVDPYLVVGRK